MTRAAVLEDPNEPDWTTQALKVIESAALTGEPFDAYDLTSWGLPNPPSSSMWGSLFREAARAKIIVKAGIHESQRPSRARGLCRVWIGASA
jgi:hypothetical protein